MKKQGNMTPQKECNHFLLTNPKEMVICELPKEKKEKKTLKVIILRKLNKIQGNGIDNSMNLEKQYMKKTSSEKRDKS